MNTSGNKSIFTASLSGLQKINKLFVNSINNLTSFEISNLSASTGNLQEQINNISGNASSQVTINENSINAINQRMLLDESHITDLQQVTSNQT